MRVCQCVSQIRIVATIMCSCKLTQLSTEGHLSSSSGYHTTVSPSWSKGKSDTWTSNSTSQSDHLGGIPHSVETLSSSLVRNHPPIRIVPLSPSSLTSSVTSSTTLSQVSMTGERGKTTRNILSNVSDEDFSVVGGDHVWSKRQIDCWNSGSSSSTKDNTLKQHLYLVHWSTGSQQGLAKHEKLPIFLPFFKAQTEEMLDL